MRGSYHNIKAFFTGLFLTSVLFISNSCRQESFSPSQADSFIKFYSLFNKDEGLDVKTLDGRGYVLAGTTYSGTNSNIILIITDKYGRETSTPKQFGGDYEDRAHSLIVLSDGGFAILGTTTVESEEESLVTNMYLVRTDHMGNELWTGNYGGINTNESGFGLAETTDGGFILIGSTENHTGVKNIYLVKTDPEGEELWTRTHTGLNDDVGLSIAERYSDEGVPKGYIFTGYTKSYSFQPGQSNSNIFIAETNQDGRIVNANTYGGNGEDFGRSLISHPEGGIVVLGTTSDPSSNEKNIFLGRIDGNISNPLWTRSLGGSDNHIAACVKITPEDYYIITGTLELTPDNHVIFLMKTDPGGNIVFTNTFGGSGKQRAQAVDIAEDGGYIITGYNKSGNNSMITLIKTNADGEL